MEFIKEEVEEKINIDDYILPSLFSDTSIVEESTQR